MYTDYIGTQLNNFQCPSNMSLKHAVGITVVDTILCTTYLYFKAHFTSFGATDSESET